MLKKKLFLESLKEDLERMENEVRLKINGEEVKERSAEEIEADVVKKTLRRE
jgi:hypothetical protein